MKWTKNSGVNQETWTKVWTKNSQQEWREAVTSGLRLVEFLEQNLSGGELQVIVEGWVHWSRANAPEGMPIERELAAIMKDCTHRTPQEGGHRLEFQKRIAEAISAMNSNL